MGEKRPVGVTETGIESSDANINSIWYGSTIGEFMKQNVEVFTPWSWKNGMWETLHLFARYNQPFYLHANSSNDSLVSVLATISESKESLSILLINRALTNSTDVEINLSNYDLPDGSYQTLVLSNLPQEETFVSHTVNALKEEATIFNDGKANITLAPLSTTTIVLNSRGPSGMSDENAPSKLKVYPTSASEVLHISGLNGDCTIQLISAEGQPVMFSSVSESGTTLNIGHLPDGYYLCAVTMGHITQTVPILKQ